MSFRGSNASSAAGGSLPTITGTAVSGQAITAAGGVTSAGTNSEIQYVVGSPDAVVVTANPQISAGVATGANLKLVGTDSTKTVSLNNGTGLILNGLCVLKQGSTIELVYDGTNWCEVSRNDI